MTFTKAAKHLAHSALMAARENGSADAEYDAITMIDSARRLDEICGCEAATFDLDGARLRRLKDAAIKILEG